MPGAQVTTAGDILESRMKAMRIIELVVNSEQRTLTDDIARQAGYADRSGAWKAVERLLARAESDTAKEYRDRQNGTLDVAVPLAARRMVEAMLEGDADAAEKRTRTWMRLAERQARLNGADAPVKAEVTVIEDWDVKMRELIGMLDAAPVASVAAQGQLEP